MKKLFEVDFQPIWPVGCCLIILADTLEEATEIAAKTITHVKNFTVTEISMDESKIVVYKSGDY